MGYMEIIFLGFVFNFVSYLVLIIYLTIGYVIENRFIRTDNRIETIKLRNKTLEDFYLKLRDLREEIKSYKKYELEYMLPYIYIIVILEFVYFVLRYGPYLGMIKILKRKEKKLLKILKEENG